ncbi:MAG: inner membrane-spanning protein YciB [Maricaulaceae bacterium]
MSEGRRVAGQGARLFADAVPIIVFFGVYIFSKRFLSESGAENAIYYATAAFIPTVLASVGYARLSEKRWPAMPVFTAIIVVVFGGLTLALRDPTFIKMKPTVVNMLFAVLIFGSLAVGRNIWKVFFRHIFELPDHAWRTLAIRWGLFFIFLAIFNEVLWRGFSEETWVTVKTFVVPALTFGFALANVGVVMRHQAKDDPTAPATARDAGE